MPGDGQRDFETPIPTPRLSLPKIGVVLLVVVCGLALLVAAVPRARNLFVGYEITVSKPSVDGDWASGSFLFHKVMFGQSWQGQGGACIVGDFAKLLPTGDVYKPGVVTTTCTTQEQCNPAGGQLAGYCIAEDKEAGRCWYKPVEEAEAVRVCRRSIDYDPPTKTWNAGVTYPVPDPDRLARFNVHDFYRDHTGGKSTQWLLIGVLKNNSGQHTVYGAPATLP